LAGILPGKRTAAAEASHEDVGASVQIKQQLHTKRGSLAGEDVDGKVDRSEEMNSIEMEER